MTIQKYEGKTKEEAIEKAKAELGDAVVVMNVKKLRPGGFMGIFQSGSVEVTVAIEDDLLSKSRPAAPPVKSALEQLSGNRFNAVADEDISIPVSPVMETVAQVAAKKPANSRIIYEKEPDNNTGGLDAEALRSVFKEVGEVIGKERNIPASSVTDYDPNSKIIRASQLERQSAVSEKTKKAPLPSSSEKITPFPGREPEKEKEKITPFKKSVPEEKAAPREEEVPDKNMKFIRVLYNNLVEHEVDEHYVNSLLSDLNKLFRDDVGMDYMISNVYQKMILQIGHPSTISINKRPKVVVLIGPTGVGKTTTIAKLASRYKIKEGKRVAFIASDPYRIAAREQLITYASILKIPLFALDEPGDMPGFLSKFNDHDLVLVDTFGFSDKNEEQKNVLRGVLEAIPEKYEKEIFLVLSATTKYRDLKRIVDSYREFTDFEIIFTKLDETDCYGNIYNIRQYAGAPLSYITTGQKVPEDISVLDSQKLVKNLLGGN